MQIIPMRDLKDTVKVEKLCKDNGEVFTIDDKGHLNVESDNKV